jgi:hypothetical protein
VSGLLSPLARFGRGLIGGAGDLAGSLVRGAQTGVSRLVDPNNALTQAGAAVLSTGPRATFAQGLGVGLSTLQEAQLRRRMMQAREQAFAPAMGVDPNDEEAMAKAFTAAIPGLAMSGDTETVRSLTELLKSRAYQASAGSRDRLGRIMPVSRPDGTQALVEFLPGGGTRELPFSPAATTRDSAALELRREGQAFSQEDKILDDFRREAEPLVQQLGKANLALVNLPAAMQGNGAMQVQMLYTFVSAMDPQSAVREGEIGLAQAAASLQQTIQSYIQRAESLGDTSAIVPPALIQQMGTVIQQMRDVAQRRYGTVLQATRTRAERAKIKDIDSVLPRYSFTPPVTGSPPNNTGAATNPAAPIYDLLSGARRP